LQNIFDYDIPPINKESFWTLLQKDNIQIKYIISNTLSTQREFVSEKDEWVVLLQGCAKIKMGDITYKLKKGDTLFIPANTKHTLLKTKKIARWLCVYL